MDRVAGAKRDVALGEIAKRAGLFFFYRSDCPYCHAQAPIIESMALNYGVEVFAIAVDGLPLPGGEFPNYKVDSGQAQSLSVTTVPAVFLVDPPNVITPIGPGAMRLDKLNEIFERIEQWTMTKTKFEVMDIRNPCGSPVRAILRVRGTSEDEGLRETGAIGEVDHPERGAYLSVGCPIKLSDSPVEVVRSPLLGEHTDEILADVLGYDQNDMNRIKESGAVGKAKE